MYLFLFPLLLGFIFNSASSFTTFFSSRLGEQHGELVCILLRDVLGIPVWVIGYAMAAMATSPYLIPSTLICSTFAWLLILVGSMVIISGLVSLRWKAAAPSVKDTLVASGIYTHIRHPLYSGMLLQLLGLALWLPQRSVLVACMIGILWVMLQARLEEFDLLQRLPAYRDYMQRVPRFVPKFKF
jgi:protein-S-isoprenylcysteine O-methyltransferase Ste14